MNNINEFNNLAHQLNQELSSIKVFIDSNSKDIVLIKKI